MIVMTYIRMIYHDMIVCLQYDMKYIIWYVTGFAKPFQISKLHIWYFKKYQIEIFKGQLQWQNKLSSKGSLLVIMIHGTNYFFIICLD